jgi:hypothetical protein
VARRLYLRQGRDLKITRTIQNVPTSDTLATVWLTLKANLTDTDVGAAMSKSITSTLTAHGQITDTGADGTGGCFFLITETESAALSAREYFYDISVETTAGGDYTLEQGVFTIQTPVRASVA